MYGGLIWLPDEYEARIMCLGHAKMAFDRPGCQHCEEVTVGMLRTRHSIVLSAVSAAPPLPPPVTIEPWDRNQWQSHSGGSLSDSGWPNTRVCCDQWSLRSLVLRTVYVPPMETTNLSNLVPRITTRCQQRSQKKTPGRGCFPQQSV